MKNRPHQLASKGCNNTTPEHSLGTDKIDGCLAQEHSSAALLSSSRSEASGVKKNSVEVVLGKLKSNLIECGTAFTS